MTIDSHDHPNSTASGNRDSFRNLGHEGSVEIDDTEISQTIPDGGHMAWLQCAGSFSLLLNSFGVINSFGRFALFRSAKADTQPLGAFQAFYQSTLLAEETSSNIAWIGSLQAFLMISLGVLAGPLYDYGYLRSLVAVGSVFAVVGMIFTGLCSKYWQLLLAQGVGIGVGTGLLFLPSIAVLPQYFDKRRALATGIGSSGSAIGLWCLGVPCRLIRLIDV